MLLSPQILTRSRAQVVVAGGVYTGPGDIVSGALAWFGLRAYNVAYATGSNPAADLVDQAGSNSVTINITAGGNLDTSAISTWVAAHSVTTIKVAKLYDQTGNAKHIVQATLAFMPVLVLGPVTGLSSSRPAITTDGTQNLVGSSNVTQAQPVTLSAVAKRTSGTSTGAIISTTNGGDSEIFFDSANQAGIYAGNALVDQSQTDNSWHALQGLGNGASSLMNVDGTSGTPSNAGSGGFGGAAQIGRDPFGQTMIGNIVEVGLWPVGFTGTDMSNMSSNQHSYWGF